MQSCEMLYAIKTAYYMYTYINNSLILFFKY